MKAEDNMNVTPPCLPLPQREEKEFNKTFPHSPVIEPCLLHVL